ncbi:hypothetical protein CH253_18300 [Rhodococcus sp. 06-156-3C]|uniref:hypothetical protein n=1 Tax=Nocardiaceae TaxID=85025 RepID=UPI000522EF61|nr:MULTISPECIES: hypothetical protein [Rhodococcus]OZD13019.1 hypothetical protein CH248_27500 [Rhodococcus sp. 06-156-4a]OZD17888.1 hypothetical protein CH253_18300 [Rhodococcus sp. 06-156-3C]OZD20613.1 hypothetical protein CH280_03455 [Rhodococcus sp. 06-156-4C]OZD30668.1 hypothetical protein CH247_15270 [Rhodococcus sp. 06-156-3b]OZD32558.1 hypothetical protein CH284_19985 [Rhodococcus sp. 06-156-3]
MGTDYRNITPESSGATPSRSTATAGQETTAVSWWRRGYVLAAAAGLVVVVLSLVLVVSLSGRSGGGDGSGGSDAIRAVHGPTTVNNGVPSGYTRDEQGASTAAVNTIQAIAQAGQGRIGMNDVRSTMIVTDPGEKLASALDIESNRDEDEDVLSLLPGAVTVTSFTQDAVEVSVWTIGVGQSEINDTGKVAVSTTYSTTDLTLVWQDGDWKAQDWSFRQGPRPEDASYPAADSALGGQLTAGYYTFYID